ncbi:hypothetical protein RAB80_010393 [Fusarium oxysporum f. sp. vasinfectum]|nr:hypothetical protein RAB80_010393 [Fusarium oxysporum f. sp. vasinfectum]
MRNTVKDSSANRDDAVSRKRTSSKDDDAPPAKRRVLTTARREQNRQAQKAYRERQKQERIRLKQEKAQAQASCGQRLRPLLKREELPSRDSSGKQRSMREINLCDEGFLETVDTSVSTPSSQNNSVKKLEPNFPDLYSLAMDPIDLSSSRVNLNGPGDWKQWISIIHKFATAQNVWKYIDPSNAEKPALSKPEEPTVQQIRPTASDLTDLTAEEFRRLEFLHTQYRTKVQTHRDQQKALSSIQQHIVKTIGNYYSTIADEHDIAKELALLKARVQPTDWAHEQEVLERYYAVLKAPNRSKIDTWITSWQRILTEAQKLDLPDIKNLRPTRQFLQAVSSINPAFTDYWINKMEDEARNKPNWQDSFPDGIKISEIFERSHKAKRATGSKAVFSTFQNEGPNQSNNGYNDGDKGSNRRSKPSCLCGKKHYYSECYYLSKAARPNGWKPNKDIEHKINQKLEDPVLKEKVNRSLERYAGQRPQEPQAVQDHQNSADVRGTAQLSILGYGQVHLRLEEGGIFILNEVAHIPAFHTNVASLDRMINKGYNWNPQTGAVTAKGKIVFHTKRINRQPVIEFNPVRPQQAPSAFSSSSEPRPEQVQEATRWHQRLGHLNPEALEQLVRHTTGARIKGPIRIDCRPCSEAKATRIISRRGPHAKAPRPFWRIYIDVFHLHESYNGKKTALLIKDEFTGMIFAYFHTEATQAALLGSLKSFESMIQRQYALGLCRIHRDNDPSLRTAYEDWIHQEGIQDEPTAPYTSAQNGPAERSGGVIATKARSMQLGANIPPELWPETWSAAVYLHNRSPQQSTGWKTPFQQLHQWLQSKNRDSGYESTSSQPDVTHLKAYGCRAYPMTGKALRNTQKKDLKTEAHAETGYLVGYDSSNIFRIWIPERSEVRRVRDVTFNEKVFFDPKDHPNNPNSVSTRRQQLQLQLPQHIESDTDEEIDQIRSADETLPEIIVNTQGLQLTSSSDHTSQEPDEEPDQGHDAYDAYPSPQLTTSSAPPEPANQQLRSQRQRRPARKLLENEAQKKAGFHIYTRSFFQGREEKLHRRSLPPEPRNWKELQGHRFEPEFKEAANMEMGSHWSRGTFKPLDAVNAFTNSLIDEDIYVLFPDGYSRRGWILKLIRALYGLRRSPLLWQKDLSNTFKQLGLELCPEDPCVFNNTWLTAFFFVDDIVFLYRSRHQQAADRLIAQLHPSVIANCGVEHISPFYQPNLSITLDHATLIQAGSNILSTFNNTSIPVHLRPTMAQILIPHHTSLDLIPLPFLRERAIMLSAAMPHVFNNWELKLDIYERGGLTIWRLKHEKGESVRDTYPPWDMKSWEAAPWFLKKWCMLMGREYDKMHNQSIGWQVVRDMISSRDIQRLTTS